jgi:hypothetical protein
MKIVYEIFIVMLSLYKNRYQYYKSDQCYRVFSGFFVYTQALAVYKREQIECY